MFFCGPHAPFTVIWYKGGFNHCFLDTVVAVVNALLMLICGGFSLRLYRKYGTPLEARLLGPPPPLYLAQIVLSLFLFLIHPVRFAVEVCHPPYFGYQLLRETVGTLVWLSSGILVFLERNYQLPTAPRTGNSVYLNVFWALALAVDTTYFVNMGATRWYFSMSTNVDVIYFAMFLIQWICELTIFIIGLYSPGIISLQRRSQFLYRPMEEQPKYGSTSGSRHSVRSVLVDVESPRPAAVASASNSADGAGFLLAVAQLREGLAENKLQTQFRRLPRQSEVATLLASKLKSNEPFNRYYNVLPYDHSRVVLAPVDDNNTDYINASSIEVAIVDLKLRNRYIAAQGPLQRTVGHFWQMVYEQRVPVIVMLTDLSEGGLAKCHSYWPPIGQSIELRELNLLVIGIHEKKNGKIWTCREFTLVPLEGPGMELTVTQMQLHGWPDHGALKDVKKLLNFWQAVRDCYPEAYDSSVQTGFDMDNSVEELAQTNPPKERGEHLSPPVVVHCSAGVGRSGAYILLETLILTFDGLASRSGSVDDDSVNEIVDFLDENRRISPLKMVAKMREQRMAMVQTEEQFTFACSCALAYCEQQKFRAA